MCRRAFDVSTTPEYLSVQQALVHKDAGKFRRRIFLGRNYGTSCYSGCYTLIVVVVVVQYTLLLTSLSGHRGKSTREGPPPCLRLLVAMTTTWVGRCPMGRQSRETCRPWSQPILRSLLHWSLQSLLLHSEIGLPQLTEKGRLHAAREIEGVSEKNTLRSVVIHTD